MADDWHEANAYAAEAERRDRDHRTLRPDGGLTLSWTGTECDRVDTARTEVVETTEAVTVTLFVQVPIDGCADWDEVERTHAVTLDEPLGDRQVEDGACELRGFWDDLRCGTGRGPGLGGLG